MDSIRRLFQHNSGGGAGSAAASSSSGAASRGADEQDVITQPTQNDPMQLDTQAQAHTDDGDDMPALVDPSDSSDDDETDDNDAMEASPTTDLPVPVAQPQINPVDRVPDRRPRVEDIDDDEDRARRTPTVPPGTPTPLSSATQSRAGSQSRPIRPLPRAFSSGRQPIPLAGSYVMQGLSYALPRRGSSSRLQQPPVAAPSQAGLVEPLAGLSLSSSPRQPLTHDVAAPASATPVGAQHPNAAPPTGTANAADGNQHDNPPAWLTGMLASIMNSIAQGYTRPQDAQADPGQGFQGTSMNMFFPDVGVAASATARQAPRAQAPGAPAPASTPGQTQNHPAPVPGPMPAPAANHAEAAFAEFQRMHTEAMRALQQRAQQLRQGTAPQQQQGAAPAPSPHAVPVPVPVPIPLPFPFAFGGPMSDEPVEDPAQARRLIEGLEEVPAGLVKRYMHVEQTADDGTGACAICWEPLDAGLEATDDVDSQQQSDNPTQATDSTPASASEDVPSEAPLRSRIVVLPCGHPFHSTCLEPWFSQRTTCPNCRYNVDPDGLTSSAYINGRRRVPGAFGAMPQLHFNGPPPGFFADLIAQLTGQVQQPSENQEQPQPGAAPNATAPPPPQPARFTFNISPLGPFPVAPPAQPQDVPPNPAPEHAHFPFNFWPTGQPAPQQAAQPAAQPAAPPANGPRIHHHHHQRQVVDGVPTTLDTFEIELDIGVTVPIDAPAGRPPQEGLGLAGMPTPPPFDMFFHFVTPFMGDMPPAPQQQQQQPPQQPQQQQHQPHPTAPAQPRQPPPPGHPLHGMPLPSFRDVFGDMRPPAAATPPQPRRKWSRPEAQGRTLRQHVEQRERELGLRCDFTSCDLAPTDEDPAPHAASATRTIHLHTTGEKHCAHTFHPQCIVTAARVAAAGVGDEPNPSAVGCPICRVEGSVELEDWAEGERLLQAELEA